MVKFSIVVPVYNVMDYLRGCVASILAQDFTDYELILVDDGSTDESGNLCEQLAAEHPSRPIRVIHQQNKGLGGARNTGIQAACGEFLFFVDSDDTIAAGCLQKIAEYIDAHPKADIVAFDYVKVDETGQILYQNHSYSDADLCASVHDEKSLLLLEHSACDKVIRRTLFLENDIVFPERIWFEDLATIIKLYPHAEAIGYIPEGFYLYLERSGSIMNSQKCDKNIDIITAFDSLLSYFKEHGYFEELYSELEYLLAFHLYYLASIRVMRIDPSHPLLTQYRVYADRAFPNFRKNHYLSKKQKIIIALLDRKSYRSINCIFKVKKILNSIKK